MGATSNVVTFSFTDGVNVVSGSTYKFTVNVLNNPPVFTTALADQTVEVGNSYTYQIYASDPEGNPAFQVNVAGLTSYITYNSMIFTLTPNYLLTNGYSTIVTVTLFDGVNSVSVSFYVKIVNKPPTFTNALVV